MARRTKSNQDDKQVNSVYMSQVFHSVSFSPVVFSLVSI